MTNPPTYQGDPVELPLRLDSDPAPVPGCDICGALTSERENARGKGDMSKVSDLNVELRSHPHKGQRR